MAFGYQPNLSAFRLARFGALVIFLGPEGGDELRRHELLGAAASVEGVLFSKGPIFIIAEPTIEAAFYIRLSNANPSRGTMRKSLMIVLTLGAFAFVATDAGAGSVSNAIKGVGSAIGTAAKGAASSSAKTAPPTSHTGPVQSTKTPNQLRSVEGESKEGRHTGE